METLCQVSHLRPLLLLLQENEAAIAAAKEADLHGDLTFKRALGSNFDVFFKQDKWTLIQDKKPQVRNRPCNCVGRPSSIISWFQIGHTGLTYEYSLHK
jgi:hypothetical protein